MRFAARLLSLILCFELIMGGYGPSIGMSSSAWAEEPCPAGTNLDKTLNRCLTSNQIASIKMAVARCNTGSVEEQKQCYRSNAENALQAEIGKNGVEENNKSKLAGEKSPLLRVGSGAAIAVPLFILTHQLFKQKEKKMVCKPASLMLMYAGAGVLLGGEVYTYVQHKKRLKVMKENWEQIAPPTAGASTDSNKVQQTETQSKAFGFLAQNEDLIAKTANTKFTFYAASAGLFAAGAVMAVVEKVKLVAARANKTAALGRGDVVTANAAQREIDRISCNLTKNEVKKKACEDSGENLMDKDGKCVKMTEDEKKRYDEEKKEERRKGMSKENRTKEDIKNARTDEQASAEKAQKLTQAQTELKTAENKLTDAETKVSTATKNLEAATGPDGKPLDQGKYNTLVQEQKVAEEERLKAFQNKTNAQTNLTNITNGTTNTPSTGTTGSTSGANSVGPNTSSSSDNKKGVNPLEVIKAGSGALKGTQKSDSEPTSESGNSGHENKGNQKKIRCESGFGGGIGPKGTWTDEGFCDCGTGKKIGVEGFCTTDVIDNLRNNKLRKTAEYNLQNSKNAYELLELTKELENIEFENYSRITNYDEIDVSEFKSLTFAGFTNQLISNLIPLDTAQALAPPPTKENCKLVFVPATEDHPAMCVSNVSGSDEQMDTAKGSQNILKAIFSNPFKKNGKDPGIIMNDAADKVDKAIAMPTTRFAINGVFGAWIGIMSKDFKEQAAISKKRSEVLKNMEKEFSTNSGITNCTDAQRNSTAKPDCYCYTPEGKRNTSRTNSAICQKMWGTFGSKASDYLADSSKVCLDLNSNPDPTCSCRAKIGPDGKNSCLKAGASSFNLSGLNTGSFKMLGSVLSPVSDLTNGVNGPGTFNDVAATTNAMRLRKAAEDMLKKSDPNAAMMVKKMSDDIAASSMASAAGLSMGGGSSGSGMASSPAEAVKALDEELEKGTKQEITTSGSSEAIGAGNAVPEKLEFGMTTEDLAIQEDQIAEVMDKDLDIDQADINKGSDTNLFDVLSNRYQRSGMRRLFDVDGKTEAEKPAETDINQ